MFSKEYHNGRTMENNLALHSLLKTLLNFDDIDSEGGGTTFRCVYTNSVNAKGKTVYKPLLSCQMKGSGGKNGEKDHCPQFHIHNNWPDAAVLHKNLLLS